MEARLHGHLLMTVLVLAEKIDATVDRVVLELGRRTVPVLRCDTADLPAQLSIHAELRDGRWEGWLRTGFRQLPLDDVRSVWYRATPRFGWPAGMTEAERRHADNETRFGLGGVLTDLPAHWVNRPAAEADAAYKARQLTVASSCGLAVPETLVSMDADAVRRFAATHRRIVIKPLGANVLYDGGTRTVAHTHLLSAQDLADLTGIDTNPHLVQRWVDKDHEVRLTAVGSQLFAVAIRASSSASKIDWRRDLGALSYQPCHVPTDVENGVAAYLKRFGLVFAAFDFVVRPDGAWVFLEANAGGQFGWIEQHTGLPISAAIADELTSGGPQ